MVNSRVVGSMAGGGQRERTHKPKCTCTLFLHDSKYPVEVVRTLPEEGVSAWQAGS